MNNRIIKFRAWYKTNNRMVVIRDLRMDPKYDYSAMVAGTTDVWDVSVNDHEYFIIQQFTGLLDKNGKEIYEGDICRVEYVEPREIKFKNGGFYFGDGTPMANFSSFTEKIEVIGNIYENPSLLK